MIKGVSVSWWAGISIPAATPDPSSGSGRPTSPRWSRTPRSCAATDRLWINLDYLGAAEMTAFVEKQAAYYTDIAGKIGIRK